MTCRVARTFPQSPGTLVQGDAFVRLQGRRVPDPALSDVTSLESDLDDVGRLGEEHGQGAGGYTGSNANSDVQGSAESAALSCQKI